MDIDFSIINNDSQNERIKITSFDKLDNNYIRVVGRGLFCDIDIVTNGICTLDFSLYNKVIKIVTYNGQDYLLAESTLGKVSLISLSDGKKVVSKASDISYLGDGLFAVSWKNLCSNESVYDVNSGNYIPFPQDMIFRDYSLGYLILKETSEESYDKHQEMIIDRLGNTVIKKTNGGIRIIDKNKFIVGNMIIDIFNNIVIKDTDLIMPLSDDKIIILKNRKLFVLNKKLEVIKTYMLGETKKPWYVVVNDEDCVTMIFKKKVRVKKYEPRVEKDVTVVINTKTDTILKLDCVPSLSKDDVFKFNGNHNKKGLMNKKSEIILDAEWDNIKPLYDKDNKYFFIEKNDECYIFDSSSKTMHRVSYEDIKEFHDGLAIGYDSKIKKYDLIDEELKTIFQLDHMGHSLFYYKNGILCYHTGSWRNGEDFYTIITKSGDVLMQPRRCRVRRNGFDILEISDYKTDNNYLFDLNSGHFINFEVDVPIIESNNGRELDCSKLPIQQLFLNDFSSFSVEDESNGVKKLLLK